jgi:hypothetical protein
LKNKNKRLIAKQAAEQESEISAWEYNTYTNDNPDLKKAKVIKQREIAKLSNELAL